jgi:TolA-binding protein
VLGTPTNAPWLWLTIVASCVHASASYAQSKKQEEQLTPLQVANACLARGDNQCLIRALEGKARTQTELGLLIETLRATDDMERAYRVMREYVQRYPNGQRTAGYRRMLETAPSPSSTDTAERPPAPTPATSAPETKPALTRAIECDGEDHCIVRALEGKAQTAEELGMLCEAYRALGDNKRARAAMQQYVARFPKGSYRDYYRTQLARTR